MPGRLVFYTTHEASSEVVERLRIDSAGNVGIGTTTSGQLLSIAGNLYVATTTFTLNASTTYATLPTFWSTTGTITNASTSALTINFSAAQSTSTAPFNVYSSTSSVFSIAPSGLVTAPNFTSTTGTITNASSTNLTATNFWSTNGTINNASSTNLTATNFWSTNGTI